MAVDGPNKPPRDLHCQVRCDLTVTGLASLKTQSGLDDLTVTITLDIATYSRPLIMLAATVLKVIAPAAFLSWSFVHIDLQFHGCHTPRHLHRHESYSACRRLLEADHAWTLRLLLWSSQCVWNVDELNLEPLVFLLPTLLVLSRAAPPLDPLRLMSSSNIPTNPSVMLRPSPRRPLARFRSPPSVDLPPLSLLFLLSIPLPSRSSSLSLKTQMLQRPWLLLVTSSSRARRKFVLWELSPRWRSLHVCTTP